MRPGNDPKSPSFRYAIHIVVWLCIRSGEAVGSTGGPRAGIHLRHNGGAMVRHYPNKNRRWTTGQLAELQRLASEQAPTPIISRELGRTQASVYTKACELGISLAPCDEWSETFESRGRSELAGPTRQRFPAE